MIGPLVLDPEPSGSAVIEHRPQLPGDKINFDAEQLDGQLTVTKIEKVRY